MKKLFGKSSKQITKDSRSRSNRLRTLRLESLEDRRLMAADTQVFHNYLIAEDVNADFRISAIDALLIINQLNSRPSEGMGEAEGSGGSTNYTDVNGDGRVSAFDALLVINRLNAEGEDPEILINYSYTITDIVSPNNTLGAPSLTQVVVGQQFQVNVFVKDMRNPEELPLNNDDIPVGGVYAAAIDLGVNTLDLADLIFDNPDNFRSGVRFSSSFDQSRLASEGADIQNEYINEATALSSSTAPRVPPDQWTPFFSLRFTATAAGTMTFNPTSPELLDSENLLIGVNMVIPNERIDFGESFSIPIVADPNIPVANADTLVTRRGVNRTITSAELLANDTGVDLPLTVTGIQAVNGTTQGTVSGNVYTPPANFIGTDTLSYTIRDAQNRTATGTITINVLAPIVATNDAFTITVNSTNNTLDVRANDTPAGLRITQVSTPSQGGAVTIVPGGSSLRYTPVAEFRGTETFTYTVTDNQPDNQTRTATVTISVVDRLPAAGSFTVEVDELTTNNAVHVLEHVQANDGEEAVLVGIGTAPSNGTARIDNNGTPDDPTDDFIYYDPNPGFVGTDSFTYIANDTSDPQEENTTGTVTVVVREVNQPPVLTNDTFNTLEKQGMTIPVATLLANDHAFLAGQNLVPSSVTIAPVSTSGGTVSLQGGNVVYTPNPNFFFGSFVFTYTVSDDYARPLSSTATVTINVTPVNDAPTVAPNLAFSGYKNVPLTIPVSSLLAGATPGPANESNQTLSVVSVAPNATNNGSTVGTVALNTAAGTVTFTPNQDYTGPAVFNFTVRDNGGTANGGVDSVQGTARITVEDFQPSVVGGHVWVDETRNGTKDAAERYLGGVAVTLTGNSLEGAIAPQTVWTLGDGSYEFADLGPGTYQITFQQPAFMSPSAFFGTTHTVTVAEPGGLLLTQNYAVNGLNGQTAYGISQLVSHYYYQDPTLVHRGAFVAIGADNSLLWSSQLDGYGGGAPFVEAVLDGNALLFTVVDANHEVRTTRLQRGEFVSVKDGAGNSLVRILGSHDDFDWTVVDRATPPFHAQNYLAAVDLIFAQQDWDDEDE